VQPLGNHSRGLVAMSGAQTRHNKGVFPQFALGMAAADPYQFWYHRFEAGPGASLPPAARASICDSLACKLSWLVVDATNA